MQQADLQDGILSFADYEASFFAYAACSAEAGNDVDGIQYSDQLESYVFAVRDNPSQDEDEQILLDEACFDEHHREVQRRWALQQAPTASDLQDSRWRAASCLRNEGIAVPKNPSNEDLATAFDDLGSVESFACRVPDPIQLDTLYDE